ncbi:MAG: glutamyl-tRNA reductase [Gammaproteobacteria bacterium]
MPIIACGINHKTAPVGLREKVVFQPEKLALYLQDLIANESIREAVLLSTCNRSELYCDTDDASKVWAWFCRQHQVSPEELHPAWYCYYEQTAIEHIMRVACGLDSMILGEPQILGQMKNAFSESCAAGSVGPQFNRLFQQVFSVAKEVRTNTSIGACPVSIASAAINLVKQVFPQPLNQATVLLIGAGDTIQLVLRHLQSQTLNKLIVANRSRENAITLAEKYSGEGIAFSELSEALKNADIVISATGSPVPIVTHAMLAPRDKPIFIVDIAVPRDVEPAVTQLQNVLLYSIDDLKNIIQTNMRGREHAAEKAQQVIKQRTHEFMAWLESIDQVAITIRAYRKQIEDLCDTELSKALRQMQRGDDPVQVLASFAHALTNKLLHNPSVQLRQAGVEGRFELLQLAQQLFAIPKPETL